VARERRQWTAEEDRLLTVLDAKQVAEQLGLSLAAVYVRRRFLGIRRNLSRRENYDLRIKLREQGKTLAEIGAELGLSYQGVQMSLASQCDVVALFERYTGYRTPAVAIFRALQSQTDRRQEIVRRTMRGQSMRNIAVDFGVSHGSIRSALRLTMMAVAKQLRHLPRYHERGREPGRGYGKRVPTV